jgi:hypothetical protein
VQFSWRAPSVAQRIVFPAGEYDWSLGQVGSCPETWRKSFEERIPRKCFFGAWTVSAALD